MGLTPESGEGFISRILGFVKGLFKGLWNYAPDSIKNSFSEGGVWNKITVVFGFFKNIYFLMTVPAIYVVYKLYIELQKLGIIQDFLNMVRGVVNMVMYIANYCFSDILKLPELASCVFNAPFAPSDKLVVPDTISYLLVHLSTFLTSF